MNQGRIWCVVSPNHGLPILIGSVALTSLIVHYSVLSHVSWFSSYWNGGFKKSAMSDGPGTAVGSATTMSGYSVSVAPVVGELGKTSFVVTVAPNADAPVIVGAASPARSN